MKRISSKVKDLSKMFKTRETIKSNQSVNLTNRATASPLGEGLFKREYYEDMLGK
jgi:hypothetical protein